MVIGADGLREGQPITERIADRHIPAAPRRLFDSGACIGVLFCQKGLLERLQFVRLDSQRGAGAAIAVMLRQINDTAIFRNLHVQREAMLKSMPPIDGEAEKIDMERNDN